MRVLFTSLFFGLVTLLTLVSHPPVESITRTFRGDLAIKPSAALPDASRAPTGIIPVLDDPLPPPIADAEAPVIPDPIAVPEMEILDTPEKEPTPEFVASPEIAIDDTIATAPEAIEPPSEETSEETPSLAPRTLIENTDTPENRRFIRSLNLHAVYFAPGATDLPMSARTSIRKAASRLRSLPDGISVIIGGHTDAHSELGDAIEIGNLRAKAVLNALIEAGTSPDLLQVAHYPTAEKRPNASDSWRDRRVEFHLLPPR